MPAHTVEDLLDTDWYRFTLKLARCTYPVRRRFYTFYERHLQTRIRKFNGYHFGVLCCAWSSGAVLVLNVIVTVWAARQFGTVGGLGTLQDGNCKESSILGFWIHLIINILSTILLGASNYTMQCLGSPTRHEVDEAHSKGSWLDVGVPSVRNIRKVSRYRQILWWLLTMSTIPLQLLWNSAVFVSLSSQDFIAWVVPSDFALYNTSLTSNRNGLGYYNASLSGNGQGVLATAAGWNWSLNHSHQDTKYLDFVNLHRSAEGLNKSVRSRESKEAMSGSLRNNSFILPNVSRPASLLNNNITVMSTHWNYSSFVDYPAAVVAQPSGLSVRDIIFAFQTKPSSFEELSAQDCLNAYRGPTISKRKNVLMVSSKDSTNVFMWSSPLTQAFDSGFSVYEQNAETPVTIDELMDANDTGYAAGSREDLISGNPLFKTYSVEHCLSQRVEEHCKLQFSSIIMAVVIVCNLIKVCSMAYITWRQDPEPLVTIGDAILSFLHQEDRTTYGLCLAYHEYFRGPKKKLVRFSPTQDGRWVDIVDFPCRCAVVWRLVQRRRFAATSNGRWFLCGGL